MSAQIKITRDKVQRGNAITKTLQMNLKLERTWRKASEICLRPLDIYSHTFSR